jgi:WD40 repeat protein
VTGPLKEQYTRADFDSLRRLNDKIPRDLETICQKAMAKDPGRRYRTAQEFAEDLRRFLRDEPIVARPIGGFVRVLHWIQRQPARAATYGLLLLVAVLGTFCAVAVMLWLEAHEARLRELENKKKADEASAKLEKLVKQLFYFRDVELAHRMLRSDEPIHADKLLEKCPAGLRGWEWRYLKRLARQGESIEKDLPAHQTCVNHIALSHDGRRFAVSGDDHLVTVWDIATQQRLLTLEGHEDLVRGLAFHPNDKLLASCSRDMTARLWNLENGKELRVLKGHSEGLNSVAFSLDGRYLVSTSFDREARVWDADTGALIDIFQQHIQSVFGVAFSPDGRYVATTSDVGDQSVKIWDVQSLRTHLSLTGHNHRVSCVAFSPDGKRLASAGGVWDDKKQGYKFAEIKLWNAENGAELLTIPGHDLAVNSLVFSPDGTRLASASEDKTVRLWDTETGQLALKLEGLPDAITCVVFHRDGERLFASSRDGSVRIWDATPLPR